MAKIPRDYQIEAKQAFFDYDWSGNPLIVIPQRLGKSLIMADIIKDVHTKYPTTHILCMASDSVLLGQNEGELREHYPFITTSFYCDKLKQKRLHGKVIYSSIQSIHKKASLIPHKIDLIFVDEAQDVSGKEGTMYHRFLEEMKVINPNIKIVGFTGTPYRPDSGYLHIGKDRVFTDVIYNYPIDLAIEEGYWCPPTTKPAEMQMDTSGVPMRNGDFAEKKLAEAIDVDDVTKACVKEIVREGRWRTSWIIYTASMEHCEHVCNEVRSYGVSCEMYHSGLPKADQERVFKAYMNGEIKALCTVMMLTVGFNNPRLDLVAIMRPMRSPLLYAQAAPRGCTPIYADGYDLSTKEGRLEAIANSVKPSTLILDFGGTIEALGPLDNVRIPDSYNHDKGDGEGEAPVKVCDKCYEINAASARHCVKCDAEFEYVLNIAAQASQEEIVSSRREPQWSNVMHVKYELWKKAGKQDSLLAKYYCGLNQVWVWYFFNFSHVDSIKWWKEAAGMDSFVPTSAQEAIDRIKEIKTPKQILTKREGKYDKVYGYEY